MPRSDPYDAAAPAPHGAEPPPFPGFRRPNYTPVPDELFDELLIELSGAELKVLLYIIRRTLGFKRDSDAISISQMLNGLHAQDGRALDRGVGLSKKTLLLALRTLEERGVILTKRRQSAEKGNEPTAYWLNVLPTADWPPEPDPGSTPPSPGGERSGEKTTPPLGEKLRQGGGVETTPPLGEFLPLPLGGKTTPSPWRKNSPTQETVRRETVEGQTVHGHTAAGQTAALFSNGFESHTNMQQTGKPSRFSKAPRFDAFLQRAADARSAPPTPSAAAPSGRADGGSVGNAAEDGIGGEQPQRAALASTPETAHAPERPKTGRRRSQGAEPASRATPDDLTPATGASQPPSEPRPEPFSAPRRETPPPLSPYLEGLVTRYSEELHDEDHIPQNLGQAGRLWRASGWSEADFGQALHKAKAITVKRDIKKRAASGGEFGARNKMPYYFKVLRDIVGLKAGVGAAQQTGA